MKERILYGNPRYFETTGHEIRPHDLYNIIMDMPFTCNYDCLKCYRKFSEYKDEVGMAARKKAIKHAVDMGVKVFVLAGEGEPLYHWDIVRELVDFCASYGLITIIYTNGSFLTEDKVSYLYDNNASIIISIDSLKEDVYSKLTRSNSFKRVMERLEMTRSMFGNAVVKNESYTITRLAIITIAMNYNQDELGEIKEMCQDDIFFICNYPIQKGSADQHWQAIAGDNLGVLKELSHKFTDTNKGGLSTPLSNGKCAALYNGITIDTNGNILACPASVDNKIGNIKTDSIEQVWNTQKVHLENIGNPSCLPRNNGERFLKNHDGNIIRSL